MRASVRESLDRLGLDRLQLVNLHDPERMTFAEATGPGGAVEALIELRDQGAIDLIGVAGGPIKLMLDYVGLDVFNAVISHNRYTLVDQSAEPLIDATASRGMAFLNAAPYGGGMLVRGPDVVPTYRYAPTAEETRNRVRPDGSGLPRVRRSTRRRCAAILVAEHSSLVNDRWHLIT